MSDTALAIPQQRDRVHLPDKDGKRPQISRKVKAALDAMVWQGLPMNEAAEQANTSTRLVRLAMARPHVIQYLKSTRQVFRESVCARNELRLAQIRDAADNMPAVAAIKALQESNADTAAGSQRQSAPGIVFIINDRNATVAVDDGTARKTIAGDVIKSSE